VIDLAGFKERLLLMNETLERFGFTASLGLAYLAYLAYMTYLAYQLFDG
jgi:hypothetical protein